METREIKIRSFVYEEEIQDFRGETITQNRQAQRGDTVELSEYWAAYGDDMGAFVTKADREAEVEDETILETAETVEEMGEDELMNWVSDSTIPQVLAVAKADPSLCQRILAAENAATGNDPRGGLVDALARIVASQEVPPPKGDDSTPVAETEESVEDLAKRLGVDLEQVDGTGEEDAITADDVKEYYDEEIADATDGAVELADDNDVFLADITGSGQDGRIVKDDVTKFLAEREAATA
jgi:pyruvate/2-oxoglutarate dehydrogenase complex dihydrolipoamide acyltransferase (E2) component